MEVIIMYSIGLIVISFIIAVTKSKLKGKAGNYIKFKCFYEKV